MVSLLLVKYDNKDMHIIAIPPTKIPVKGNLSAWRMPPMPDSAKAHNNMRPLGLISLVELLFSKF